MNKVPNSDPDYIPIVTDEDKRLHSPKLPTDEFWSPMEERWTPISKFEIAKVYQDFIAEFIYRRHK